MSLNITCIRLKQNPKRNGETKKQIQAK